MDRIIVPGAQAAQQRDVALPEHAGAIPLGCPHSEPGFSFNGTLVDIAVNDAATSR